MLPFLVLAGSASEGKTDGEGGFGGTGGFYAGSCGFVLCAVARGAPAAEDVGACKEELNDVAHCWLERIMG